MRNIKSWYIPFSIFLDRAIVKGAAREVGEIFQSQISATQDQGHYDPENELHR